MGCFKDQNLYNLVDPYSTWHKTTEMSYTWNFFLIQATTKNHAGKITVLVCQGELPCSPLPAAPARCGGRCTSSLWRHLCQRAVCGGMCACQLNVAACVPAHQGDGRHLCQRAVAACVLATCVGSERDYASTMWRHVCQCASAAAYVCQQLTHCGGICASSLWWQPYSLPVYWECGGSRGGGRAHYTSTLLQHYEDVLHYAVYSGATTCSSIFYLGIKVSLVVGIRIAELLYTHTYFAGLAVCSTLGHSCI